MLPPRERDVVERLAVDLRALLLRAVPLLAAPVRLLLRAVPLLAAPVPLLFDELEREPELPDLAERVPLLFARVDFLAPLEREPVDRDLLAPLLLEREPPPDLPLPESCSSDHEPDITRCAASATASAIKEPRRVALDITVFAACDAESAASMPASRIFLRADGLALIAAAAAASPAASISLLIAALVILSTVLSFEPREPDDDFRLLVFAIANLPVGSVH